MTWDILEGNCLTVLRDLDAGSVQTCVTSPPYWGLRDYGTATWEGGDSECDHRSGPQDRNGRETPGGRGGSFPPSEHPRQQCRCGAKRIDSQLGLESTPEQYVENLVTVFREVRRVLRDDGTVWLNLGDSYAGGKTGRGDAGRVGEDGFNGGGAVAEYVAQRKPPPGLKPKDLVGIPWRVAFALQADGWWLRSDIIWAKPNPMPESVTDRPTRAHEYIFLLSKSARYFYDADAVREANIAEDGRTHNGDYDPARERNRGGRSDGLTTPLGPRWNLAGRNKRSVWTVTTQPYSEAHFATFPPKLIEPCILAGSPPKCCGECGAAFERIREKTGRMIQQQNGPTTVKAHIQANGPHGATSSLSTGFSPEYETTGWAPICDCGLSEGGKSKDNSAQAPLAESTVLDPFAGAGTTGLVATQHGRDFIGIELNPEYAEMARERIRRYEANPAGALEGDPEPIEGQLGFL